MSATAIAEKKDKPKASAVESEPDSRPRRALDGWVAAVVGGLCGGLAFDPSGLRFLVPLAPLFFFIAVRASPSAGGAFLRLFVRRVGLVGLRLSLGGANLRPAAGTRLRPWMLPRGP